MSDRDLRRVLFVCLGNICRSPTAEGVMHRLIVERGLEKQIHVDSAGTIGYHAGEPADLRMSDTAARRGYTLTSVSRPFTALDFDRFDLIVVMDRENLRDIRALETRRHDHVKLFSEFLPEGFEPDVPDPYLGEAGFDRTLDLIEYGCPAILQVLLHWPTS